MRAKREYRDRPETQVAVLDALVDRSENGMSVFELRAAVPAEIDALEGALSALKEDGLIEVERSEGGTVIKAAARVIPEEPDDDEASIGEWLRQRLPF